MSDKPRETAAGGAASGAGSRDASPASQSNSTRIYQRAELEEEILTMLQQEIPAKLHDDNPGQPVTLTRASRKDEIEIDSIAVIQTIFKIEETYDISIDIDNQVDFENAGQLVDLLIASFPPGRVQG